MPDTDVWFYSPDGTGRRHQPTTTAVTAGRWKSTRRAGYSEATFTLVGDLDALSESEFAGGPQPVREDDWVRVKVGGELRWAGFVSEVTRQASDPLSLEIAAHGFFTKVSQVPVDSRFVSPVPTDIAQAFASFASIEARRAYPNMVVDIQAAETGILTSVEDAFNQTIGSAFENLSERFGGRYVYGCDELYDGAIGSPLVNRLYLRPVNSTDDPDYTIVVPGGILGCAVESAEGGKDIMRLVNSLTIVGADPANPNLLSFACNGNVGFEKPFFTQTSFGGLISDPSFEAPVLSSWTLYGGATQKNAEVEGLFQRSGRRYIELDAIGEGVRRTITTSLTAGQTVVAGINGRRENAGVPGYYRIKIQFRNGASNVGSLLQSPDISPEDAVYVDQSFQVPVPSSPVTGFELSYEMTAGGGTGTGLCLDDSYAYVPTLRQEGWDLKKEGSATINSIDWAHSADQTQGRYSIKFDLSAGDADGNDAYLQPLGKFPVLPGMIVEFGSDYRAWDGETNGKMRLDLRFYKEDGSEISGSGDLETFNAGTLGDSWQQISNDATVPDEAALCLPRVTFRGDNRGYFDRMYCRSASADTVDGEREWIDAGPYTLEIDTDNDLFTGKDYHDSIATYGRRYGRIESDAVIDRTTALAVAEAYFDIWALPLSRPILRLVGSPITFKPGQMIRVTGKLGRWLGGDPGDGNFSRSFPIAEVEETIGKGGEIRTTLALEVEQPSMVNVIERLFDRKRRATSGGGIPVFAAGSGSTSSSGSGMVAHTHPATEITFDSTGLSYTSATDVQQAIEDLDAAILPGGGSMTWTKYDLAYTDFTGFASTAGDILLTSIPAKTIVHRVMAKHSVQFAGGAFATLVLTVGVTASSYSDLFSSFNLLLSVSDTTFSSLSAPDRMLNYGSAVDVRVRLNGSGANLSTLTQGAVSVWVLTSTIP